MILGITGGIASGKSSVSRLLSSYCLAPLIDMDACCRNLLALGEPGWRTLHEALGTVYELPSGEIDRPRFRAALFADATLRQQVNSLLHPVALDKMWAELARFAKAPLVLAEVPLLYEAGWQVHMDRVLAVVASPDVQISRVLSRDGVDEVQARQALTAQMDLVEKACRADYVIENSGDWPKVREAVLRLGERLERELVAQCPGA